MPEIKRVNHSRELFCLIGEYFASAELRKEFGEPMTSDKSYTWFLALEEETVQGFSAVRVGSKKGELNYCYVLPEYRGRGVATKLLESRIEYLRSIGVEIIETIIVPGRLGAFEKHGFKEISRRGQYIKMRKVLL